MTKRKIQAPEHLSESTREWWLEVVANWDLEGHHLKLLTMAAEAWDRSVQARETIAGCGPYYNDRFGCPHAHPAIAVERDCRIQFARLVRELDLDVEPPRDPSRPPHLARYERR